MNGFIITNQMIKQAKVLALLAVLFLMFMLSLAAQAEAQEVKPVEVVKPQHVEYISFENFQDALALQSLQPASSGDDISHKLANRISAKITSDLLKQADLQKNPILKTAASVDQKVQTHINLGSSKDGGINHTINFNLKTVEGQAVIDYQGFFNSKIAYLAESNTLDVSVVHSLFRDTTLNLTSLSNLGQGSQENKVTLCHKF